MKSGLVAAAVHNSIKKPPSDMISAAIILIEIIANGLIAAGGFVANFIVNMSAILAASFTIPEAQVINPSYQ